MPILYSFLFIIIIAGALVILYAYQFNKLQHSKTKINHAESVVCWGTGKPLREFLYVDDLANLCVFLMNNYSGNETVNAGTGKAVVLSNTSNLFSGDVIAGSTESPAFIAGAVSLKAASSITIIIVPKAAAMSAIMPTESLPTPTMARIRRPLRSNMRKIKSSMRSTNSSPTSHI